MFEKYTEKARRAIFFSRYEASQIGGSSIDSGHILLGLLREDLDLFRKLMPGADLRAAAAAVRNEIQASHPGEQRVAASVDLPLSASAKRMLSNAADESNKMGHLHIGTEHLLLGMLRDAESLGCRILINCGIKLEEAEALAAGRCLAPQRKTEAPVAEFLSRLNALVEVLIRRGAFTGEEFVEDLASRPVSPDVRATLQSLIELLSHKGVITENDKREIIELSGSSSKDRSI